MPTVVTSVQAKEASIQAVVIRCRCEPGTMDHPGAPCPRGEREDHGTVSYYHRNPLRRWIWAARHRKA